MKYLHISSKVENRIAALDKAGKAGNVPARETAIIIQNPASGGIRNHMETVGTCTKYGGKQIKNR